MDANIVTVFQSDQNDKLIGSPIVRIFGSVDGSNFGPAARSTLGFELTSFTGSSSHGHVFSADES